MQPTVFVIDDDESVRRGLVRLLRSAGYAAEAFGSAGEFLATALSERGDGPLTGCIVTDLRMPGMNGLELQQAMACARIHLPVLFISGKADVPDTVRALKGGAMDFLVKPFDEGTLLTAIDAAMARDAGRASVERRLAALTPREREVCLLVARGLLNKQIAHELGTSEKTIKVHRARMMEKLRVDSVAELVRFVDSIPEGSRQA